MEAVNKERVKDFSKENETLRNENEQLRKIVKELEARVEYLRSCQIW